MTPQLSPEADLLEALDLVRSGKWTAEDYAEWDKTRPGLSGRRVFHAAEVRFAVSKKGAVSIYGLNRLPVTLYANQIEKLGEKWSLLMDFVNANRDKLATKEKPIKPPAE